MRWLSSQSAVGFDERNKRRSGGISGDGGAVWEMAAASLHNDDFLDAEERHERASHGANTYDDTLLGGPTSARGLAMATKTSN